jgi:hypothetical protein
MLAVTKCAIGSEAVGLHGDWGCESGETAGGDSLPASTASAGGGLGTVMRHYLCCGCATFAPLVHAGRVFVSPGATLLIALAGLALPNQSGDVRALCSAVALATVTLAAHQGLRLTACAQEKPAGLFVHDTSGSTRVMAGL